MNDFKDCREAVKKVTLIQIKEAMCNELYSANIQTSLAMFEEVCTNQNSWLKWKKNQIVKS